MTRSSILKTIRAKKLGLLVHDQRIKAHKTVEDCAKALGIPVDEFSRIEMGERPPTLPEVEILAYYLKVQPDNLMGGVLQPAPSAENLVDTKQVTEARQKEIGELIQDKRVRAELSLDDLAEKTGIPAESLNNYEQGSAPIPLTELENLAQEMQCSLSDFKDQQGPIGKWISEQKNCNEFVSLSPDLQEFISKPINRPYLELAIKLSELKVERLRSLAEGLLEITL